MTPQLKVIYRKFPSQDDCIAYLEKVRWNKVPTCPRCGYSKFSPIKDKSAYHCNMCNRTFTVTAQTLFHRSKLDLQKWFYVIHLMLNPNQNITARELARQIEVTKDTAWKIQQKIKGAMISAPQLIQTIDNKLNQ